MPKRAETLIVGGGVAGLATAWGLAQRGAQGVHLLEREARLGFWSSGRNAGILRTAIHAPATRQIALASARAFADPPHELLTHAPEPLFDPIGLLLYEGHAGSPDPLWLADLQAEGAVQAGAPPELESAYVAEGVRTWWLPGAGRVQVDALIEALRGAAQEAGVQVHTQAQVESLWKNGNGQVQGVHTANGESWEAERIVLAPGAWVQPFAQSLGLPFPARTTRRHLFFAVPTADWNPQAPVVWDDAASFYFLGTRQGELLLSLCDGDDADPDRLIADPMLARLVQRRARASLGFLSPLDWRRSLVGIRTVSEDDVPIIDRHPGQERLFWVAALGGHGVTLSLGLGPLAADILLAPEQTSPLRAALAFDHPDRQVQLVRDYAPL